MIPLLWFDVALIVAMALTFFGFIAWATRVTDPTPRPRAEKCIGIGRLFGHNFDWQANRTCWRCGFKP